ncbi:hypothetical protein GGR55DRAFT_117719 [Xylaria sp. FL0064]|nr:hypothetical protein GGR55DRAFT_117719 [Xylaria sp. FL0064]
MSCPVVLRQQCLRRRVWRKRFGWVDSSVYLSILTATGIATNLDLSTRPMFADNNDVEYREPFSMCSTLVSGLACSFAVVLTVAASSYSRGRRISPGEPLRTKSRSPLGPWGSWASP